jgi:hypothetical protein
VKITRKNLREMIIREMGELIDFSVERQKRVGGGSGELAGGPPEMQHVVRDYDYEKQYGGELTTAIVGSSVLNPNPPLGHPDHISRYPESYDDPSKALMRAARSLQEIGVPLSTKVGILEDSGGYFQPSIIGTLKDALSGATPQSFRWQSIDEDHNYEIMYFDVSSGGIDDIRQEMVPFISLGRVFV